VLTRRGWAAAGTGLFLWVAARFMGSPDLHMVAAGLVVLPVISLLLVRWGRVRVTVHRSLSGVRVFPGTRVVVTLTVRNEGRGTLSFLLLEDAVPPSIGKPARLVVTGIPAGLDQTASYSFVSRERGVYSIGPLAVTATDPFGLARTRAVTTAQSELIVYPRVEQLQPWKLGAQGAGSGESAVRHLQRTAADFYTMRPYVTGDDLRRIHWPSVARTGELMIRQDESTRRSWATLFLDSRAGALGVSGSQAFERVVSCAASIGRVLLRAGFTMTLGTADGIGREVSETALLEFLARVSQARVHGVAEVLTRLRSASPSESTLAVVAPLPVPSEISVLTRTGMAFGRKLAVLVLPVQAPGPGRTGPSELDLRARTARASLLRAGWDAYLVAPNGTLAEEWQRRNPRRLPATASLSS
jgi:uncharacterized protein (DUF58 family)